MSESQEIELAATPNGTRVVAHRADGSQVDVTDGVQAMYDHLVASMDWGSQFLDVEDAAGIIRIAQACGFLVPETAEAMFGDYVQHMARIDRRYDSGITIPESTGIKCVECSSGVFWMPDYFRPEFVAEVGVEPGWHHIDRFLDGGHTPRLWATR